MRYFIWPIVFLGTVTHLSFVASMVNDKSFAIFQIYADINLEPVSYVDNINIYIALVCLWYFEYLVIDLFVHNLVFAVAQICCPCTGNNQLDPQNPELHKSIVHQRYIAAENQQVNGFLNFRFGRQEVQLEQAVNGARNRVASIYQNGDQPISHLDSFSNSFQGRRSLRHGSLNKSSKFMRVDILSLGFCPICTVEFDLDENLTLLACHPSHVLHDDCYEQYTKFNESKSKKSLCPTCRAEIKPAETKKKILKEERNQKPSEINASQALELVMAPDNEMVVPPQGEPLPPMPISGSNQVYPLDDLNGRQSYEE